MRKHNDVYVEKFTHVSINRGVFLRIDHIFVNFYVRKHIEKILFLKLCFRIKACNNKMICNEKEKVFEHSGQDPYFVP